MIQSIRLCLRHSGRVRRYRTITFFSGLNTVLGPNGSGKSTLLRAVFKCPDCWRTVSSPTRYRYFNSEIMNPHVSPGGFGGARGSIVRVRAMFSSHGETMRDVLAAFPFEAGDCLLVDEPENGHDLGWVLKIRAGFDQIIRQGCQVIVASHHPVFWDAPRLIELAAGYRRRIGGKYRQLLEDLRDAGR